MVESALVTAGIETGRRLFEILNSDGRLRIEACFWWTEGEESRFYIVTPVSHEKGFLYTLRLGRELLQEREVAGDVQELFERAKFVSPSDNLILALARRMPEYKPPLNRWMDREGLGGIYVEGAYFYSFEPRSFMPGVTP